MAVCLARASGWGSFSSATSRRSAFTASARYIAPLSRYKYRSSAATRRETLLLPEPAGPSMAMVSFGIFVAQPLLAARIFLEWSEKQHGQECPRYLKPHDVIAAIDEDRLAGNARARF